MDTSTSLESATDSDGDDEMTTYSEAKVTLHRVMPFELNSKPVNGEESSSHSKQNVSQGHGESQGLGELIVVKQPSNASVVRKSDDHQRETAPSVLPLEKVKKSDSPRVAKRTPGPKRAEKWSSKSFRKPA
jgi:hypothetical protein